MSNSAVRLGAQRDRAQMVGAVKSANPGHSEHIVARQMAAEKMTAELADHVRELESVLAVGVARDARVGFGDRRGEPTLADLPIELASLAAPDRARFDPPPLGWLAALAPGAAAKRAQAAAAADGAYEAASRRWERMKAQRDEALARLAREVRAHNDALEEFGIAVASGQPEAVNRYAKMVLLASPYPEHFPREVETGFLPGSATLTVDMRVPTLEEITPRVDHFKFLKADDHIVAIGRPREARQALYERIVAQMALRTFHEVFSTDAGRQIAAVQLNLHTGSIDPTTGQFAIFPVVAGTVSRGQLAELELSRVEPVACLRRLVGPEGFPAGE